MKIALTLVIVLLGALATLGFLNSNRVFDRSLKVHLNEEAVFDVSAGDTVTFVVPISNNSYNAVHVVDQAGSCRVLGVEAPRTFERKHVIRARVRVAVPAQEGTFAETVVLRTDGDDVFYGLTIRYRARPAAGLPKTVWTGRLKVAV